MRKKGKNCKDESFLCRLSKEERDRLEYISHVTGRTKSEIIREGLKMQYELAKYEH